MASLKLNYFLEPNITMKQDRLLCDCYLGSWKEGSGKVEKS